MNRQLISVAIGNIREEHITAALCRISNPTAPSHIKGSGRRQSSRFSRRRLFIAALAAALLLALAVTAYATGLFASLFAKANEQFAPPEAELYDRAGEMSNKAPETFDLKALPGNTFTLSESFYDGENLLLAYSMDSMKYPVQFGFGPGDEGFDQLWSMGRWYINAQWETEISAEDYDKICEDLRGKENTGFIIRTFYLSDHIRLTDGTDLGPTLRNYVIDGNVILECQEGLPDTAKNKNELELVFTVREMLSYYYKEGETFYQNHLNLSEESVTVSVPNCGEP